MQNTAILPLFYLPPVGYFSLLQQLGEDFLIEQHEHLAKQTYRNRASIYSPNGKLDITVPLVKGSKTHTKMKDVRISYDFNWQRLHWLSLESCYRSSAYFEFYEDELSRFYTEKFEFLFDYNLELLMWLNKKLKLNKRFELTGEYFDNIQPALDFRSAMNPKKPEDIVNNKPYYQVFEDKHQFLPNLSIVDLLFNQGPQARLYL
ncbi:WbqC-like protein family protein [Pedobacter suwonensis]|uniref:WbqC-like protein family protein n=1 Tax=Pedobacter suwonensis TaxID=332999 RepID=A0A1I0SE74_9SPHI|nr:WbqC family protein [Pedobacter suwonensis]SFA37799.1 WbqC-like protein family protein [Pedobacter suwonensis]